MKYLKLHIFFIGLLFSVSGFSQIRAIEFEIIVDQPYPRTIEEFLTIQDKLLINVFNNTDVEQEFVMQLEIYKDGDLWAYTKPDFNGLMMMLDEFGSETIDATNSESYGFSLNENDITFSDSNDRDYLAFNRALPDGLYSICISAFDADVTAGQAPIRISEGYPISCGEPFQIIFTQAPLLLNNVNEECIDVEEDESLFFDWWMISGTDENAMIEYDFKVIEYTPGGTAPEQLFADGIAVIHEESNIVFPGDFTHEFNPVETSSGMQMVPGNFYAWQIRINSIGGLLQSGDQSYSPVGIFKYRYCDMDDIFDDLEDTDTDNLDDCNCTLSSSETQNTEAINSEITSFRAGSFGVVTRGAITPIDGRYSGEGLIRVGLLNNVLVKVAFENIKINAEGYMMPTDGSEEGGVFYTLNDDTESVSEQLSSFIDNTVAGVGNSTGIPIPGGNGDLLIGQIDPDKVADFDQLMRNVDVANDIIAGNERGMPLAIQQEFNGMDIMLGITAIKFSADPIEGHKAEYHLMVNIPINIEDDIKYISFGAWVCGGPSGFAPDAVLHMVNNLIIGDETDEENFVFTFEGGGTELANLDQDAAAEHTFLSFDCQGITGGRLQGKVQLPVASFVMEDGNGKRTNEAVILDFSGEFSVEETEYNGEAAEETSDLNMMFTLDGSETLFQYKELEGWGFRIENAILDLSDIKNHSSMEFPEEYPSQSEEFENTWTGLYIEEMAVLSPVDFLKTGTQRKSITLDGTLIEPEFTSIISIENILDTDEGRIGDWGLSIDRMEAKIVRNDLLEASMNGQVYAPFTINEDDEITDNETFDYSALIEFSSETDKNEYTFNISTNGKIGFPLWKADVTINENAYVTIEKNDTQEVFTVDARLNGQISIVNSTVSVGSKLPKYKLPSLNFELDYDTQNGFKRSSFGLIGGVILSDQGYFENYPDNNDLAFQNVKGGPNLNHQSNSIPPSVETPEFMGFSVSLEDIRLGSLMTKNPSLQITPRVNFTGDDGNGSNATENFSAAAYLEIHSTFNAEDLKISFDKIEFKGMELHVLIKNKIRIDGYLNVFNDDGIWGNGLKGKLAVQLPSGIGAYMSGAFGTKGEGQYKYRYWYVDAMANFGQSGVAIGGVVSMHGLGGGIYKNVNPNFGEGAFSQAILGSTEVSKPEEGENQKSDEEVDIKEPKNSLEEVNISINQLAEPFPENGLFSVEIKSILAVTGSSSAYNMDVGLSATFEEGQGLTELNVNGHGYFMTPMEDRDNPIIDASVDLKFVFGNDEENDDFTFLGNISTYMNLDARFINFKGSKETTITLNGSSSVKHKMAQAALYFSSGEANEWYIYVGNPYAEDQGFEGAIVPANSPASITATAGSGGFSMNATASAYFMLGNPIPSTLPPLPEDVMNFISEMNAGRGDNTLLNDIVNPGDGEERILARGIAFGTSLYIKNEFDAFLLYADIEAFIGFDFNLSYTDGCNGESDIGINNYYANGRAYAGFKAGLGVNNPLGFGPDKISLFEASALALVAGGGPNPFWFKGVIGVRYSVFNGLIEGDEFLEFDVGEECIPPISDPFGVRVIADLTPKGDEISPSVFPNVIFNVPIGVPYKYEEYDASEGAMVLKTVKPYIKSLTISDGVGIKTKHYSNKNKQVTIVPDQFFELGKRYSVNIEIRAEKPDGSDWIAAGEVSPWSEDSTIIFTIVSDLEDMHDLVEYTTPVHARRYVPTNEISAGPSVTFRESINNYINQQVKTKNTQLTELLTGWPDEMNNAFGLHIIGSVRNVNSGEVIYQENLMTLNEFLSESNTNRLTVPFSDFENERYYEVDIYVGRNKLNIGRGSNPNELDDKLSEANSNAVSDISEYTGESIDQSNDLNRGEIADENTNELLEAVIDQKIVTFFFRTSKYDSYEDKLEDANIRFQNRSKVKFVLAEPLDKYEARKNITYSQFSKYKYRNKNVNLTGYTYPVYKRMFANVPNIYGEAGAFRISYKGNSQYFASLKTKYANKIFELHNNFKNVELSSVKFKMVTRRKSNNNRERWHYRYAKLRDVSNSNWHKKFYKNLEFDRPNTSDPTYRFSRYSDFAGVIHGSYYWLHRIKNPGTEFTAFRYDFSGQIRGMVTAQEIASFDVPSNSNLANSSWNQNQGSLIGAAVVISSFNFYSFGNISKILNNSNLNVGSTYDVTNNFNIGQIPNSNPTSNNNPIYTYNLNLHNHTPIKAELVKIQRRYINLMNKTINSYRVHTGSKWLYNVEDFGFYLRPAIWKNVSSKGTFERRMLTGDLNTFDGITTSHYPTLILKSGSYNQNIN